MLLIYHCLVRTFVHTKSCLTLRFDYIANLPLRLACEPHLTLIPPWAETYLRAFSFLETFNTLSTPPLSTSSLSASRRPSGSSTFLFLSAPLTLTYTYFFQRCLRFDLFLIRLCGHSYLCLFITGVISPSCSLLLSKEVFFPGIEIARILSLRNISLSSFLFFESLATNPVRIEAK